MHQQSAAANGLCRLHSALQDVPEEAAPQAAPLEALVDRQPREERHRDRVAPAAR